MKHGFAISRVFPGELNALVKGLMQKTNIDNPAEVVRSMNAGEWTLTRNTSVLKSSSKLPLYEFVDLPCDIPDSLIIAMYLDGVDGVPRNVFSEEEIYAFMEVQSKGEEGPLLTDGRYNIFYSLTTDDEYKDEFPVSVDAAQWSAPGKWSIGPDWSKPDRVQHKGSRIFRRVR
jgi:hypothetical protein